MIRGCACLDREEGEINRGFIVIIPLGLNVPLDGKVRLSGRLIDERNDHGKSAQVISHPI